MIAVVAALARRTSIAALTSLVALLSLQFGAARATPDGLVALTDRILVSSPGHRLSEFNVAQNPNDAMHLVVAGMDWDSSSGGVGCVAYVSRDGGRTWAAGTSSWPGEPRWRGDPWAAVAPDGDAHLVCLDAPALLHAVSVDGGLTWGSPRDVPAATPGNFRDKPAMLVTRTGRLVICVNDFPAPDDDLWVYRSDDRGATWLPPLALEADQGQEGRANCPDIAEGPAGEVYAGHMTVRWPTPERYVQEYGTVASYDGGDTWQPAVVAGSGYFGGSTAHELLGAPPTEPSPAVMSLAVSPISSTVFAAMAHYDLSTGLWEPRLHKSADQGRTYADVPLPPIQSARCTPCHVARPTVTVDSAGRLAVEILVASLDGGLYREVWLLVSEDEGATWLEPFMVASTERLPSSYANPLTWTSQDPWILRHPEDPQGGIDDLSTKEPRSSERHLRWGGDYWDLTSTPDGFVALWVDQQNGFPQIWGRIVAVEQ